MIFKAGEYAQSKTAMPNREDESLDKDSKEYNLQVANYVYSQFCRGGTYVDYDTYNSVEINRAYALGQQSEEKYMDAFYGKESSNNVLEVSQNSNTRHARRKAYANLNFTIQSPAPRIMDSVVNKLAALVNRVSVDATDRYSGARKEDLKWGTWVDGKYREQFNALRAMMALPEMERGYTPSNKEELNLYEAEGGFKLSHEEVMERLLKFVFEQSHWEEHIQEKVLADLVTSGFAVVEDVYDENTGHVKVEYRDAKYSGVQFTQEDAYRKPDYGFYVKMVKLSDIRRMGFEDSEVVGLAKKFSKLFGNPNVDDWNASNKNGKDTYQQGYDQFTVPVFVVKWIDVEYKNEKQYKNRQGKTRTKNVENGYKPKDREKLLKTRVKTNREVHWIIDSDLVYDYGKCRFQGRDGMSDPVLPIHMVKVSGRPIVPRFIPSLDQYMNAWMRLQQGISMAAMNGFAINMDAISNLNMGGKKMSPREVLRFWRQTGTLFFKPTDVAGHPNPGMITRPIEQLPGGAGAVIAESLQVMDVSMKQIETLTGINPIAMGAEPTADTGKAVTEMSLAGTNDILKGVLKKGNIIKSDAARACVLRLQHVVESDKKAYKAYTDVVGESSLKLLKIAGGGDIKYGMRTHARPTEQDIRELKEVIALSLKNGRDGKVGITEADAVRFNSMINSGASLKRVALLLDFANKKAQEEAEERAMRAQQLNAQQEQMSTQQKAENASREKLEQAQADIAVANAKGRADVIEKAVAEGKLSWEQALGMLGNMPQGGQPQQTPRQEVSERETRVTPTQEEVV